MVWTRSQAQRQRERSHGSSGQVGDRRDSGDDCHVVDTSASDSDLSTVHAATRTSSGKGSSLHLKAPDDGGEASSATPSNLSHVSPIQEERLGRGCRVPRTIVSLDEEYLKTLLSRSRSQQHRSTALNHLSGDSTNTVQDKTDHGVESNPMQRRYPQREAAKRALENLRVTLTHHNGASAVGTVDEDSNSNSMGPFNFRHHPELVEEMKSSRARHGRRRGRGSDSDTDDESTTTSASSSEVGAPNGRVAMRRLTHGSPRQFIGTSATRPTSVAPSHAVAPSTMLSTRLKAQKWGGGDGASMDSSISDASMQEESVERMTQRDQRAYPSSSSSEDNDGDFKTEAQRRSAIRNARESATHNTSINYYMADAAGIEDPHRVRCRQLDRRYRWLLHQEEDARARADGYGGGDAGSSGSAAAATNANGVLGDIVPLRVDSGVTFDSVGGLPEHLVTLREMVLLPLLYPDLFERLDLKAPRGVLFVGPPGTGKTLMARALANEGGARIGRSDGPASPAITFFVRKGADLLSKWVGESERQLKLLFEEAQRLQPSIIFFDEIDGLAPTRHAKTEQTQAALVSTLLALLDGLEDRGQVVVIGATNRPDTLDPALRRPGRFDRELLFPLPDAAARRHILTIQLAKKAMPASVEERASLLDDLVEMTEGYSGADLGALCTEASLHRLRTALPQLYLSSRRLLVPHELEQTQLHVRTEDFYAAAQLMQPALRRSHSGGVGAAMDLFLEPYVEVLVRGTRDAVLAALAPSWSLVDKALLAGSRDCRDMRSAVRSLCTVPIPQPPRPCLLILTEEEAAAAGSAHTTAWTPLWANGPSREQHGRQRELWLHHLSVSLLKGLPRLPQLRVHLPQLSWKEGEDEEGGGAAAAVVWGAPAAAPEDYLGGMGYKAGVDGGFTHMSQVVQSVRQSSPCVVYLSGAAEWLWETMGEAEDHEDGTAKADEDGPPSGAEGGKTTTVLGISSTENSSVTRTTPVVVRAHLSRRGWQRVRRLRYHLNSLADTDVLFVLPCATAEVGELLIGAVECPHSELGSAASLADTRTGVFDSLSPFSPLLETDQWQAAVHLVRYSARQQLLHPQLSVVRAAVSAVPLPGDLRRFVQYIYRTVSMTLRLHRRHHSDGLDWSDHPCSDPTSTALAGEYKASTTAGGWAAMLKEDQTSPLPSLPSTYLRSRRRADRAHRCERWRKVEYRRLQLRHVLMKWVSQYINSGKFKLLASADLDLTPDHPLYKAWQQHTRSHRIGLQDILEKVEDEAYVCLSQYHNDIDQLVQNVRSFFRTRAAQDQRYRLKALDLKETCLLNMYKMNRSVVRFCEETREVQEPSSEEDEEGEKNGDGAAGRCHLHDERSTALLPKDADPALIAENARRAVRFSQHPSPPMRRKPRRYFGERRRRRRPTTRAKLEAAPPGEKGVEGCTGGQEEAQREAATAPARVTAAEPRVENPSSSTPFDVKSKEGTEPEGSAGGVEDVAITVEQQQQQWACQLMASFAYTRLYHVFKAIMRGLELKARALTLSQEAVHPMKASASCTTPLVGLHSGAATADTPAGTVVAAEALTPTLNSFVSSAFQQLVLAAVEE